MLEFSVVCLIHITHVIYCVDSPSLISHWQAQVLTTGSASASRHEHPDWVRPGPRAQDSGLGTKSLPEAQRPRQRHPHPGGSQGQ